MTLGEKIKELRQLKKWTQKELGEHCGISEATIRKYELGLRNPKKESLNKIAEALEIDPILLDENFIKFGNSPAGEIISLLITLDNIVGLSFDGPRNNEGNLDPATMSIRLKNQKVNVSLSDWEGLRRSSLEKNLEDVARLSEKKYDMSAGEVLNVLKYRLQEKTAK